MCPPSFTKSLEIYSAVLGNLYSSPQKQTPDQDHPLHMLPVTSIQGVSVQKPEDLEVLIHSSLYYHSLHLFPTAAQRLFFDIQVETCVPPLMPPASSPVTFGSRLTFFAHSWNKMKMDCWVLEIINQEYSIEFLSFPPHKFPSQSLFRSHSHQLMLQQEVESFLH